MPDDLPYPSDVAFTPAVKAIQDRKGSRDNYARMEEGEGWSTTITPALAAFIAEQNSVYLGTANAAGQPYIQHRGGPPGFLRVLDESTLAFVDFKGNRQYITQGNLAENPKAFIFLMDYARRRRIKLWGTALVRRRRCRAGEVPDAGGIPGATRTGVHVQPVGVGRELPAAHPEARRPGADGSRGCRQGPDDPRTHRTGCRADAPVAGRRRRSGLTEPTGSTPSYHPRPGPRCGSRKAALSP